MATVTISTIQTKRSFTSGALPTSLLEGEEFVNLADGFRLMGDGVTAPAQLPKIPFTPAENLPLSQAAQSALQGKLNTDGDASQTAAQAAGAAASRLISAWLPDTAFRVPSFTALRSFPVSALVDGAVIHVSGYYGAADGGGGPVTWSAASTAADDACTVFQPTGGASTGRFLRDVVKFGLVNARACGVKADGVTDDTIALQRAINLCKGRGGDGKPAASLLLPAGVIRHTGIVLNRGIYLYGDPRGTTLNAAAGITGPGITIACAYDTSNYYANGAPPCRVRLSNLVLLHDNYNDVPGRNVAHGISIQNAASNSVYTVVHLDDIEIYGSPGDGINTAGFLGFAIVNQLYISSSYRDNFSLTSAYDWRVSNVDLIYAGRDNMLVASTAGLKTFGLNSYNAKRNGLTIYGDVGSPGVNYYYGTELDSNGQSGLQYDERDPNAVNVFIGGNFAQNSQLTAGTYPDVLVTATANSQLRFTAGWRFNTPNGNFSIQFAGTGNTVQANDVVIQAGAPTVANKFSNAPAQVLMSGQPWLQYTPTCTGGTGATFGTATGWFNRVGKTVHFRLVIPQSANGTGAGSVTASLPYPAANTGGFFYPVGREINATNADLRGQIGPGSTTVSITTAAVGYPGGNGYQLTLSGTYECQ